VGSAGMHARPATVFADLATQYESDIRCVLNQDRQWKVDGGAPKPRHALRRERSESLPRDRMPKQL
jgi:hypothetical protein